MHDMLLFAFVEQSHVAAACRIIRFDAQIRRFAVQPLPALCRIEQSYLCNTHGNDPLHVADEKFLFDERAKEKIQTPKEKIISPFYFLGKAF